jgi:hypothetical protein
MAFWPIFRRTLVAGVMVAVHGLPGQAQENRNKPLPRGVEQLRHVHGEWNVTTEFLNPDGTVARSVEGTYTFRWVVPDRVISGESRIPSLNQASGILFYVSEARGVTEMTTVGTDGRLWVMTGPIDGEVRTTPPTRMDDGTTMELRFTRYNVAANTFESKMEYSTDGGRTWRPGNHQLFRRKST